MGAKLLAERLHVASLAAKVAIDSSSRDDRAEWARVPRHLADSFAKDLLSVPAIASLENLWCTYPYGGSRLQASGYVYYLIHRAISKSSQDIIDDLLRFAEGRTVELTSITTVEGLVVGSRISLGEGYSIVPPADLPQVEIAKNLFAPSNAPRHGWGSPPSAAIIFEEVLKIPLSAAIENGDTPSPMDRSAVEAGFIRALKAVMLSSDSAPQMRQQYDVVRSPGWPGMECSSHRGAENFPVVVRPGRIFDEELTVRLFRALRTAGDQLDLAIAKLESARRRRDFVEAVVDLGTCLEVLLMHSDQGGGEITYKISLRAAWVMGKDGQDREYYFRLAKKLYQARSKAVHEGKLPKLKESLGWLARQEEIGSYEQLCTKLIIRIALDGKFPDWTKLVLGAER